jgi:2-polyprenyl-3-methyl-5-hydroxy-6-metoxy-1,4-benzoquinol methylase
MPVNEKQSSGEVLYQRKQYDNAGLGRLYWDYRDRVAMSLLDEHDRHIVDMGCGEGITLERAAGMFPLSNVIGIDYMQENVDICLEHGLSAYQGSVYDIDLEDNSVDAVLLLEVIEHLEYHKEAIGQIRRILRPGGKLIVVFPNDRSFKLARILTFKFKEAVFDPGHVRRWKYKELKRVLEGQGFSVYFSRSIPFGFWPISLHGVVGCRKIV